MTGCIGVFMVPMGFRFEKPRPGNPCGAWAAARKPLRGMGCGQLPGYSGFYFNCWEIF